MTTVHFVRHGETVWHRENRYAGTSDIPLTGLGVEQGSALAAWAATQPIERVMCSNLGRAVETARRSAEVLGLPLEVDPRLREVHFGRAEGMTSDEMDAAFPAERARFVASPATHPLPGGECGADAIDRALPVLAGLAQDATVLIVAHTTLGRLLLCHLLGLPLDEYRRRFPRIENGTVTTLDLPHADAPAGLGGRAALLRFNAPV